LDTADTARRKTRASAVQQYSFYPQTAG